VEQDNYKTIAAACLAHGHTLVAQSPIDVNIAKQLNIQLSDLDFPMDRVVIDPLSSAVGYGLEYTYSIMERIRLDGLDGDEMLSMPMLVVPGFESAAVKESWLPDGEIPEWGKAEDRCAAWEIAMSISLMLAGADLLLMLHPLAIETVLRKRAQIYS
jgi:acetyl-CoA decarbonylase/synthase complex subunit delta